MSLSFAGAVATLTFDDPDRGNPMNTASLQTMAAELDEVRRARSHVLVLRSAGSAFCVGGDLQAFASAPDPAAYIGELASLLHAIIVELHQLETIVVCAVGGVAAGAGFPLTAAADIVVAHTNARFTCAYTNVGLTPDGGTSLLVETLGLHRTLRAALLNPVLSAQELYDAGLVTAVTDDLDATVDQVVATLLAGPRDAQVAAKRLIRTQAMTHPETTLAREARAIAGAAASPDGREGVQAFVAKRRPTFTS